MNYPPKVKRSPRRPLPTRQVWRGRGAGGGGGSWIGDSAGKPPTSHQPPTRQQVAAAPTFIPPNHRHRRRRGKTCVIIMSSSTPPPSAPTSLRSSSSLDCGFVSTSTATEVTESDGRIHSRRFIFSLGNSGVVAGPVLRDDFIQLTDQGIRYARNKHCYM